MSEKKSTILVIDDGSDQATAAASALDADLVGSLPRDDDVEFAIIMASVPILHFDINDVVRPIPRKPKQTRAEWRRSMKGGR